jgi:MscS family membrane protein
MEWLNALNNTVVAGNELWRILALFIALLAGLGGGRAAQFAMHRSARVLESRGRSSAAVATRSVSKVLLFAGFIIGFKLGFAFLLASESASALASTLVSVMISVLVGFAAYSLVDVVDHALVRAVRAERGTLGDMMRPMVRTSLRVTIIILVLLQIAQLLTDKPLTSILAGLGVGGLAIALAAQDTVKNFFGSLVIFADKPFQIGERVVVDSTDGVVEEVGFRSTRIRTLEGHLVTIPNGELANKAIQNIGRRPHIRRLFNVAIPLDTPPEKARRATEIIRELLADHPGQHPDFPPRVVFNDITTTALNILVIYWFHPPDFWAFQSFNEQFNLHLIERFRAEGLAFAYPTQTVHLAHAAVRPA